MLLIWLPFLYFFMRWSIRRKPLRPYAFKSRLYKQKTVRKRMGVLDEDLI